MHRPSSRFQGRALTRAGHQVLSYAYSLVNDNVLPAAWRGVSALAMAGLGQ